MMDGGIDMKNIVSTALIAFSVSAFSFGMNAQEVSEFVDNTNKYMKSHGFKLITNGDVIIKSIHSLRGDEAKSMINKNLLIKKQIDNKGYVLQDSEGAKSLLNFNAKNELYYDRNKHNKGFTGLYKNKFDLNMAYTFQDLPTELVDESFGMAPYGAYRQENPNATGWDGAAVYFKSNNYMCTFSEHNMELARGGVELYQEMISSEVNGKHTIVYAEGNKKTGYLYQIKWYSKPFAYELECGAPTYSDNIKNDVIELAKKIDSYR